MGIEQTKEKFLYVQGGCGEEVFYTMERLILSDNISMITVDSVSAIIPRSELEGDIGNPVVRSIFVQFALPVVLVWSSWVQ